MTFNQFSLLKTKRFLPLFLTQFLGAFHDNLFKNALVVLILYNVTVDAPIAPEILVTLATAIFILPFILFSATGGQLADKYPKHLVIRKIKMAEILVAVLGLISLVSGSIALSFFTLFALGTQSAFFGPSKYSILPVHLKDHELIGGNALVNTGTFLAILIGTIAGTLMITLPYGAGTVGMFLLVIAVAGFISSLYIPATESSKQNLEIRRNPFSGTIANLKRTWGQSRTVVRAVFGIGWFYFLGALYLSQFPNYTRLILGADEQVLALFIALFSIGVGIGGLLNNRLLGGAVSAKFVPYAALGITIFTIDLFLASLPFAGVLPTDVLVTLGAFIGEWSGMRIAFDIFMISVCGGLFVVPLFATVQHFTDDSARARIVAGNAIINSCFILASAGFAALLLTLGLGITELFLLFGIVNLGAVRVFKMTP